MRKLSIALIEDSPLFGAALFSVLQRLRFSVVLSPPDQRAGKRMTVPDVVLFDVVTFAGTSQQLGELVKTYSEDSPVLLLGREDRIEQIISGLRAGAVGVLKQTAPIRQLRKAITTVAEGSTCCDRALFRKIMHYLPTTELPDWQQPSLTAREQQVLRSVCRGESNKEIAQDLGVTEQSVKVYVSNLLRKTGTSNRSSLTSRAITRGLLESV